MSYPLEKYRFYVAGNRVIAVSTYAGKSVRGVAVCASEDNFDLETGKRIAAARCNARIAEKRHRRAEKRYKEAVAQWQKAENHLQAMSKYLTDAAIADEEAKRACEN